MSSAQSSQKLIVITSGLIAQYVIHYFDLGLVFGGLALLASCGALAAVHFSREEAAINLDDGVPAGPPEWFNGTSPALQRRLDIKYCIGGTAQAGVCIAVTSVLTQIGTGIGGALKGKSNNHDCSAQADQIDNVTYRVYATGQNCDTTTQLGNIAGAIDTYLRDVGSDVCGTHCIQLTHGRTWAGYVTIAPAGTDVNSFYCGSSYTFGSCGEGGVNDQHA